jgi:hypothetical protein
MSALMYLIGWLSYMTFAKGEVQEWAKIGETFSDVDLEVTINWFAAISFITTIFHLRYIISRVLGFVFVHSYLLYVFT